MLMGGRGRGRARARARGRGRGAPQGRGRGRGAAQQPSARGRNAPARPARGRGRPRKRRASEMEERWPVGMAVPGYAHEGYESRIGGPVRDASAELPLLWLPGRGVPSTSTVNPMEAPMKKRKIQDMEIDEEDEDVFVANTYAEYTPAKYLAGKPHPDQVVETASLSSVEPPDITYDLSLPKSTIDEGMLSALQLEAITYACQQHERMLPDGSRAGFLVGDGAGVGKGRTIAGLIFENFLQGRKRSIWVSVSNDLVYDALRDLNDIGAKDMLVTPLAKMSYREIPLKKGVLFSTYTALTGHSGRSGDGRKSRLSQIVNWWGKDYDGLIVFDECHRAKNLIPTGTAKPTKTGIAVVELQRQLPKARILYASATGASEPKNMAYMTRLGLWGDGTPFRLFDDFLRTVQNRGVGAMEMVAMEMKLRGMYIARQLSFHGVTFRIELAHLTDDFVKVYDESVELWVEAYKGFVEACEILGSYLEGYSRKIIWGQFWGAHQRFFKYLCIAVKVPYAVRLTKYVKTSYE